MRRSHLFLKTRKEISKEEVSRNAQLLTRGSYVNQVMAGVYSYLPLGLRVLTKIEQIVREEMNAIGSQEVLMPALHPREIWDVTGRWDKVDVLFKLKGAGDRDLALGPTHEEVVTPLASTVINSYRDLPQAVYHIQTKFRNEARAKSGLLRGREFRMKDLYSFHTTQEDLDTFYDRVMAAYMKIYRRIGLGERTLITYASGGVFSKYSHEFQTLTDSGEDVVYAIPGTTEVLGVQERFAINSEIIDDQEALRGILPNYQPGDEQKLVQHKTIEVGNIFKLGTRFSSACGLTFADKDGKPQHPIMGCYGIGPSRMMGTIAEILSDEKGLIWPEEVAPYKVNLLNLKASDATTTQAADALYDTLQRAGVEVLYDDRDVSAGEKFADADLLGCPWQAVVGPKGAEKGVVEWANRRTGAKQELPVGQWPW
ncbi:MAG: prolyl-tRNA synthetase [Alphaproteobacteria bacterium]|nr:prolyl-tRNA synthetase [Alphaproteobacteria bacterium]